MPDPYYADESVTLYHGDALAVARELPTGAADCIVTSPPYFGLRNYGEPGQYGQEPSPVEYVETMRALFAELRRVLAGDGTLWLNLGDSYNNTAAGQNRPNANRDGTSDAKQRAAETANGRRSSLPAGDLAHKNLLGMPWRVAFALQEDGWILRNAIVWHKPNAMPESVMDRMSTRYEQLFLFSKADRYWFDLGPIRKPLAESAVGANPGDVWSINTQPFPGAHFAVMPTELAERCIQAGCRPGGTVLDTFSGSGTTGLAAGRHSRQYIGIDLNANYLDLSLRTRLQQPSLLSVAAPTEEKSDA